MYTDSFMSSESFLTDEAATNMDIKWKDVCKRQQDLLEQVSQSLSASKTQARNYKKQHEEVIVFTIFLIVCTVEISLKAFGLLRARLKFGP